MLTIKKIVLCSTILFIILFAGCKTKKDSIPSPTQKVNEKIKKITVSGTDQQEYNFSYDNNNVLTSIVSKGVGDLDFTEQLVSNYTFDANGNISTVSTEYNDPVHGNMVLVLQYQYDSQNRITLVKESDSGSPFHDIRRYYYSSGNTWKISVDVNYDTPSGSYITSDSTIYYSYNSFNKPDSSKHYYIFSPTLKYDQERYSYDGYGNLIKLESRQTSQGGSWLTKKERQYDHNNIVIYPKEFYYFLYAIDDTESFLDPDNDLENVIPTQDIEYATCNNSTAYTLTGVITSEKNANGNITRQSIQEEDLDAAACIKTSSTIEYLFYY